MPAVPDLVPEADAVLRTFTTDFLATHPGRLSYWCGGLDGEVWLAHEPDQTYYAASTMKLPLMAATHLSLHGGRLAPDQPVVVGDEFASALPGARFRMEPDDDADQDPATWLAMGESLPLSELLRRSVVRSGNLATNLVLAQVGSAAVAEVLQLAGCSELTSLPRGIEDRPAREAGLDNLVTAADLGRMMAAIGDRRLGAQEACAAMEDLLAQQEFRDRIPAGLPPGTYAACKSGWVPGINHDVALVRAGDLAYVLAVCTEVETDEDTSTGAIAEISRLVWSALAC